MNKIIFAFFAGFAFMTLIGVFCAWIGGVHPFTPAAADYATVTIFLSFVVGAAVAGITASKALP